MSKRINNIFSRISGNYDLMNRLLSFGVDKGWRRNTVSDIIATSKGRKELKILDIATGTGDLAIELSMELERSGISAQVTGMDFNSAMLAFAGPKAGKAGADVKFEFGDALRMKYKDSTFDVLTSGFALRNFDDLDRFAKESHRILKRGGSFVFVDMAIPDKAHQRAFFRVYSVFMRFMGLFVDNESYAWLVRSIRTFDKKALVRTMSRAGFKDVRYRELKSGIAYIIAGRKN